nr:hypothetical protein HmN_000657700 [Hymenolepis microstoma]
MAFDFLPCISQAVKFPTHEFCRIRAVTGALKVVENTVQLMMSAKVMVEAPLRKTWLKPDVKQVNGE